MPLFGWVRLHEAVWLCGGREVWTHGEQLVPARELPKPRFLTCMFLSQPSVYIPSNPKTMKYLQATMSK